MKHNTNKLALVVDDSVMQCKVSEVLLVEEGYQVLCAHDGQKGVSMYFEHKPDLVLMDINMPVMNGYEAAREIKAASSHSLCPLIFITSMDTDGAYIEAVEAGGDGILVRPFSPEVFKAKIKSLQRFSDLYSQIKSLQLDRQRDAELAEKLMSNVVESRNFARDRIGIFKQAAMLFSGDIQLTAACPNGNINVLLGDFTGHGLRSSIGAISLSETFHAMSRKGFSLIDIVNQINSQMYRILPADLFLSVAFVTLSIHEDSAIVLNAGLPDVYHFNGEGQIVNTFQSSHPPLGVLPDLLPDVGVEVRKVSQADHIVLISDGIIEARNVSGEMFELYRFEQAAMNGVRKKNVTESVMSAVKSFCQNMTQEDDISLIDFPCGGWEALFQDMLTQESTQQSTSASVASSQIISAPTTDPAWEWELNLTNSRLKNANPIPLAMSQINEIENNAEHWQNFYTILTELFVNALDHGVLALSSDLKACPEGFAEYFKERERRFANMECGFVKIKIQFFEQDRGGRVMLTIKDSGQGFDVSSMTNSNGEVSSTQLCGRGLNLVRQLSESMEFSEQGTLVRVCYHWVES